MKCLSKEDITLFCYGELEKERSVRIEEHLKECHRCHKLYEETKEFLSLLKAEREELSSYEVENIVRTVRERIEESKRKGMLEKLGGFFDNMFRGLNPRLRLVPVVAGIIVFLLLIPVFVHKHTGSVSNLDVIQVEMELSLEDEDASEFDVYYNFNGADLDSTQGFLPFSSPSHVV